MKSRAGGQAEIEVVEKDVVHVNQPSSPSVGSHMAPCSSYKHRLKEEF